MLGSHDVRREVLLDVSLGPARAPCSPIGMERPMDMAVSFFGTHAT